MADAFSRQNKQLREEIVRLRQTVDRQKVKLRVLLDALKLERKATHATD